MELDKIVMELEKLIGEEKRIITESDETRLYSVGQLDALLHARAIVKAVQKSAELASKEVEF